MTSRQPKLTGPKIYPVWFTFYHSGEPRDDNWGVWRKYRSEAARDQATKDLQESQAKAAALGYIFEFTNKDPNS